VSKITKDNFAKKQRTFTFAAGLYNKSLFLMQNKPLALLLLLLFLSPVLWRGGAVAFFVLNRAYVASEWCENKDKPQLKCDGKCYLKRQLNGLQESQAQLQQQPKPQKQESSNIPSQWLKWETTPCVLPLPKGIILPQAPQFLALSFPQHPATLGLSDSPLPRTAWQAESFSPPEVV
jgi:hypothetical protein